MQNKEQHRLSRIRRFFQRNKWLSIGVFGAVLAFIGGAGLHAVSVPWLLSADAPYHLDYAWQIYQGTLPQLAEGPVIPVDISLFRNHLVAQHPPLYYAILAPFVGPFIAEGDWELATGIGRLITLSIGILSLLAMAWVGWVIGGQHRRVLAVAAPAVAATFVPFVAVTSAIYSDALMVLLATLAFGLAALVLYRGPRKLYLGCLALVLLLGMATRLSFISMFGLALVAVVVSCIIHGKNKMSKNAFKGIGYAAVTVLITMAGIGWFYYFHNFETSGSIVSARPEGIERARRYKPFVQVITSRDLWYLAPFGLFGRSLQKIDDFTLNQWVSYMVFLVGISGSIMWLVKQKAWQMLTKVKAVPVLVGCMLITYAGLVFTQQIVYATGYGMYSPRYLLPAWIAAGIVLTFGILAWRRRGTGVIVVVLAGWAANVNWTVFTLATETDLLMSHGWLHILQSGAAHNGFPVALVPVLLSAIAIGIVLSSVSVWRLTSSATPATSASASGMLEDSATSKM